MPAMERRCFGLILAVAVLTGCGGSGGSAGGPAAPSASSGIGTHSIASLDGTWRGTSAQGRPMSFTVRNGRLVSLTTQWTGQGGGGCTQTSEHSMDVQIFTGGSTLGHFTH